MERVKIIIGMMSNLREEIINAKKSLNLINNKKGA